MTLTSAREQTATPTRSAGSTVFFSIVIFISNKKKRLAVVQSLAIHATTISILLYPTTEPREYACEAGSRPLPSLSCKTDQRRAMPRQCTDAGVEHDRTGSRRPDTAHARFRAVSRSRGQLIATLFRAPPNSAGRRTGQRGAQNMSRLRATGAPFLALTGLAGQNAVD